MRHYGVGAEEKDGADVAKVVAALPGVVVLHVVHEGSSGRFEVGTVALRNNKNYVCISKSGAVFTT